MCSAVPSCRRYGQIRDTFSMRTLAPFVLLFLTAPLTAQTLDGVLVDPPEPTECQLITLTFSGTLPQGAQFLSWEPELSNGTLQITLNASGGSGAPEEFVQVLPGLGPLAAGVYDLVFSLSYDGTLVATMTGTLTVGPGVSFNAGEDGAVQVCTSDDPFLLFELLGGTPDMGGSWIDPNGMPLTEGAFEPGTSPEGAYTYFFDLEPPCVDDAAQVTVTYMPNNFPGISSSATVCTAGLPMQIFSLLGGEPYASGSWASPFGAPHNGVFNPGIDICGPYTYTVPGIAPCGDVSATVTLECVEPPAVGEAMSTIFCNADTLLVLNDLVFGETVLGHWTSPAGTVVAQYGEAVDIGQNGAGNYYYVAEGGVCTDDSIAVFVQFSCELDPCLVLDIPMQNGSAFDVSTYAHYTSLVGPTPTTDRFGAADNALYFDGVDDAVLVGPSSALALSDEATFSLWYRVDSLPYDVVSQQFVAALLDKSIPGSGDGPQLHLVRDELETNPCEADEARARLLTSPEPVTGSCYANGAWRHLVATFDNGLTKLYVNGVLDASLTVASTTIQPNAHPLMIGANAMSGIYRFKGAMDDLLIYRCALTDEQVDSLYTGQSTALAPTPAFAHSSVTVDGSQQLLHVLCEGPAQLDLMDATGRQVLRTRSNGREWWWNYQALPTGAYLLRVQRNGAVDVHRVLLP
jgi:hypothetical protein